MKNDPVGLDGHTWYYENKGSLDLVVSPGPSANINDAGRQGIQCRDSDGIIVRIPYSKLVSTLRRHGYCAKRTTKRGI